MTLRLEPGSFVPFEITGPTRELLARWVLAQLLQSGN